MTWIFYGGVLVYVVVAAIEIFVTGRIQARRNQWTPKERIVPGEMNAPWEEFPELCCVSSGWRQGYGQGYLYDWDDWYQQLSPQERAAYQVRHAQPTDWYDFYKVRDARAEQRDCES